MSVDDLASGDTVATSGQVVGRLVQDEAALAGETIANRYDVLELVATGGMGAVYRARDRELDELVALKVIRHELASLPAMVARFRHEVKLARRVTHVNVARTFELGIFGDLVFCTMELVEGESLAKRLSTRGPMQVGEAVAVACAVCDGLAAAHAAGVIHRDIKPDNVLLAPDGRVVVADFGVAAAGVAAAGEGGGELSGTPAYMAPEQARGEAATAATDVYAVGVMLYQMLTGHLPFQGALVEVLDAKMKSERIVPTSRDIPGALGAVIGDATARDVPARIGSAKQLRDALAPWAAHVQPNAVIAQRATRAPEGLATIIVLAPTGDRSSPNHYVASAVHEEVLARLIKTPRLRVLPRARLGGETSTFAIAFAVGDMLEVKVTLPRGTPIGMSFPLEFAQLQAVVEAIVAVVDAEVSRPVERDEDADLANDLLLQARDIAYRDFTRVDEALAKLERARELAPQHPRVLATLAIGYIRAAFFRPELYRDGLEKARLWATSAIVLAPDLALAHIACGHLELTTQTPERAASHFRIAIGIAPHLAEAHEQLGRMLLEAGYLELALARLDEAIAISPSLRSANWEIARAHALNGRWDEHERIIKELTSEGLDRPMSRARYAWWRRDWKQLERLRVNLREIDRMLWPGVIETLFEIFLGGKPWESAQQALIGALRMDADNRRRRVFIAQLGAEAAAFAGATDAVVELLEHATNDGLFDLHWFDHCVMLDGYRDSPAMQRVREKIAARAHAILDALYGDHAAAVSETQVA
jgi:serine/threonine-protein kinase